MKKKVLVVGIIILLIIPIILKILNNPKNRLIKDGYKIKEVLDKYTMPSNIEEVLIDNGFVLDNNEYKVKGTGVIFLEEDYSFMLSNNNMCVMYLSHEDIYGSKLMFQEENCPNYRLIDGNKEVTK